MADKFQLYNNRKFSEFHENTEDTIPENHPEPLMATAAGFTLLISLITLTIYFSVFQSFLRKNQIQSSEFNLQLVITTASLLIWQILFISANGPVPTARF